MPKYLAFRGDLSPMHAHTNNLVVDRTDTVIGELRLQDTNTNIITNAYYNFLKKYEKYIYI